MGTLEDFTDFIVKEGADQIPHTKRTYLEHALCVYKDLKSWGCEEDVCNAGFFHSIYGTQGFDTYTLPIERRNELCELIGERAERLAFLNCFVERSTFDPNVARGEGPYIVTNRATNEEIEVSPEDFRDVITIHLCDYCEQMPRMKRWNYRREGYRMMAERLGGVAKTNYDRVIAMDTRG